MDREILAVCDEDIVGQTFEEGDLRFIVSENFYKGEKKSDQETLDLIKNYDTINMVGKKIIKLAIENDIINEEDVIYIQGIPHIQLFGL